MLRRAATPVAAFDANLAQVVQAMFKVMVCAGGVGLAAPQIGLGRRLFVMRYGGVELAVVNPSIEISGRQVVAEEGCLSLPGRSCMVRRGPKVRLTGHRVDGSKLSVRLVDWPARIIQHELDHLDGVMIDAREADTGYC